MFEKNIYKNYCSKIVDLAVTSKEPFEITVAKVEISDAFDEYGRNIARIQIPRSILYANAIEVKKFDKEDGDGDNDNDNDNDKEHDEHITSSRNII